MVLFVVVEDVVYGDCVIGEDAANDILPLGVAPHGDCLSFVGVVVVGLVGDIGVAVVGVVVVVDEDCEVDAESPPPVAI